ncbi:hypothetical protein LPJ66_000956 [Kickxella alabastrina]|uniref:Uncharacterized protein n=1 Tax=Kickxella alabastrina TaxID=61397 RepID=A0ACC1IUM3_9FUNG|nr:hypothetical protein LPJ66_000956 [Kickxella alabastrina]
MQYYLQPTKDSNIILKRKHSNENAENYSPGKRAKAHTELTVDIIPPSLPATIVLNRKLLKTFRTRIPKPYSSLYRMTYPNTTSLAESEVKSYQKRAITVTRAVCKAMQHFISNHRPTDSKRVLAKLIDDDSTQAAQMFRMEDAAISESAEHIGEEHFIFSKWATTGTSVDQAHHMYPESSVLNADAFVLFIAHLVDEHHRYAEGEQGRPEPRRVLLLSVALVTEMTNGQGNDLSSLGIVAMSVDNVLASRIESTITSKSKIAEISNEWHANLFAPIKVRQGSLYNDKYEAEVKLIKRCRKIQCMQPNRGFQWGLTICDSLVQVYLFGSNFFIASENMDIRTEEGRNKVIRLFDNWSYTEDYRLGYDSTIKHLHDLRC